MDKLYIVLQMNSGCLPILIGPYDMVKQIEELLVQKGWRKVRDCQFQKGSKLAYINCPQGPANWLD